MRFLAGMSLMTKAAHTRTARRLSRLVLTILAVAASGAVPATAMAKPDNAKRHIGQGGNDGPHGTNSSWSGNREAFYTQTNDPNGNSVVWFRRGANGKLRPAKTPVSTGGKGLAMTPPFGFPTADGEGSVNLTPDGKLLFVVNAGDNTVSSFLVKKSGPKLVSHISSGGTLPISLTSNGHLLYVVKHGRERQHLRVQVFEERPPEAAQLDATARHEGAGRRCRGSRRDRLLP